MKLAEKFRLNSTNCGLCLSINVGFIVHERFSVTYSWWDPVRALIILKRIRNKSLFPGFRLSKVDFLLLDDIKVARTHFSVVHILKCVIDSTCKIINLNGIGNFCSKALKTNLSSYLKSSRYFILFPYILIVKPTVCTNFSNLFLE